MISEKDDRAISGILAFKTDPENFDGAADAERAFREYLDTEATADNFHRLFDLVMNDRSRTWLQKYIEYVGLCPDDPSQEERCKDHFLRLWQWTYGFPWPKKGA